MLQLKSSKQCRLLHCERRGKAVKQGVIKMEALTLWSLVGFLFAAYAVIANDSVQTLDTVPFVLVHQVSIDVIWGLLVGSILERPL